MKALLVTPVEQGAGETITSLHVAQNLADRGHGVLFLASPFASRFVSKHFPHQVVELGKDSGRNRETWETALQEFHPDVVVFADYPLMFFPMGVSPLVREPGWIESLDEVDACLVTLDHFGFAQRERGFYFGPAHLTCLQYQRFPRIPERMQILLPCPMHEPGPVAGRRGHPFRYWDLPLGVPDGGRQHIRRQYLERENDILVFHSVPNWAWQATEALGLTFYRFLPQILDLYFGSLPRPVTIVSVNNGRLLEASPGLRVRLANLGPIPTAEFETLLFGSDLVITENKVSISMGKAVCGLQPCAALTNSYGILELMDRLGGRLREVVLGMENARPGTVYPYEVFPSGMKELLDDIGLYRDNSLLRAFCELEIFGGTDTATALGRLLTDPAARQDLQEQQQKYVDKLCDLGDSCQVLCRVVEENRRQC